MINNYSGLFSPLYLPDANVILKNRFEVCPSSPVFIQGPEPISKKRCQFNYCSSYYMGWQTAAADNRKCSIIRTFSRHGFI